MLCFTPSIFKYIEEGFPRFFEENKDDLLTGEYLIPDVVEKLTIKGIVSTKVLPTTAKWIGVTYKEDKEDVVNALQSLKDKGFYPDKLWK